MFTHLPAIGSRFTPLLDYSGADFDLGAGSQFINIGTIADSSNFEERLHLIFDHPKDEGGARRQ